MQAIRTRSAPEVRAVAELALRHGIHYGESDCGLSWLPSAVSIRLEPEEWSGIRSDTEAVWEWYRSWADLYCESIRGDADPSIAELTEFGMQAHEIEIHREFVRSRMRPLSCRLEYIYASGRRYITEVQWVSGGLGLFAGIDWAYQTSTGSRKNPSLLADGLLETFASATVGERGILSVVRDDWLAGERFLSRRAAEANISFAAVDRDHCDEPLRRAVTAVGLIYGQGYTTLAPKETFKELARKALDSEFRVESPYNYIYRQKWGLSLLHDPRYADRFPACLRSITPISVLLNPARPHFDLLRSVDEAFGQVSALEDVLALPESRRRMIVVKSGAGVGGYQSNGRGVFRLAGSRQSARRTLDFVRKRISLGEPWIMQPFSSSALRLPLPSDYTAETPVEQDSHVKLMAFGTWPDEEGAPRLAGALANYGRHWKVGGRSPRLDAAGHQEGSVFTDVVIT